MAQTGSPRLVPTEGLREISLGCFPNRQARHLCAARFELLNRLAPRHTGIAVLCEFRPSGAEHVRIRRRGPDQVGLEAIPQLLGQLNPLVGRQVREIEERRGHTEVWQREVSRSRGR